MSELTAEYVKGYDAGFAKAAKFYYAAGAAAQRERDAEIGTVLDVPFVEGILSQYDKGYVDALRSYRLVIRAAPLAEPTDGAPGKELDLS